MQLSNYLIRALINMCRSQLTKRPISTDVFVDDYRMKIRGKFNEVYICEFDGAEQYAVVC
jgi:hypothetical protein